MASRKKTLQTNFSAGEIAPELGMRQDTDQYQNGAKSLRNRRCLVGGGTKRRPGSWREADQFALSRIEEFTVNQTTRYVLAFSAGRMDAYVQNVTTGHLTAAGFLTNCRWTGTIWNEMDFAQSGNTMFLTHQSMPTQILTRSGAASWLVTNFAFFIGNVGRPEQVYLKVANPSMTLRPSALTGSITLTASAALFTAAHVGQFIRYLSKAMVITAVASSVSATALVIEELPRTQLLTVTSSAGFAVDDIVLGSLSGAKGLVRSVGAGANSVSAAVIASPGVDYAEGDILQVVGGTGTAATLVVGSAGAVGGSFNLTVSSHGDYSVAPANPVSLLSLTGIGSGATATLTIAGTTSITATIIEKLIPFQVEDLTGPNAKTAISAVADTTPAAVHDWDEQLFGPVYGYPAAVEMHRNRLLFAGHPAAPDYLIASVIANFYNFNVGTGADADAIIESVGDAAASQIMQLHSGEQLLVLTDHGPYYVPESKSNPFIPSSMAFFPFGSPWPTTATCKARAFDDGVLYASGSLIIKARPTGNVSQQWDANDDVGIIANHIIRNPARMAVVSNFAGGSERYSVFINSDGTLAVLQLVETQKIRNVTPWDTEHGIYTSVVGVGRHLYATTQRTINNITRYYIELFDQNLTLDLATQYATAADMNSGVPGRYGSTAVNVVVGGTQHLGTYPPTVSTLPDGPFVVGLNYEAVVETLPPVVDGPEGTAAGDMMRIVEAYVHVIGSQRFSTNGYTLQAYQISDDIGDPPPNKDGPQRFQFLGWQREPTLTIAQPDPLPLDVLAVKTTVAF